MRKFAYKKYKYKDCFEALHLNIVKKVYSKTIGSMIVPMRKMETPTGYAFWFDFETY